MECKINKNYVGNLFQLEISIFLVSACTQSKLRFLEEILNKKSGIEVIKLEYTLRLKIKRNDWLLTDTCPQAANHCALF